MSGRCSTSYSSSERAYQNWSTNALDRCRCFQNSVSDQFMALLFFKNNLNILILIFFQLKFIFIKCTDFEEETYGVKYPNDCEGK